MTGKKIRKMSKGIHFLTATKDKKPFDLQKLLNKSLNKMTSVATREMNLKRGVVMRIQRSKKGRDGSLLLHFTRYNPGEAAPTLKPGNTAKTDTEKNQNAPKGREFKDGEAYFLVRENNILFLSNGIRLEPVTSYLFKLFTQCGYAKEERRFSIEPMSDIDQLDLIAEHGVKSICLNAMAHQVSIPVKERSTWAMKTLGTVTDQVTSLISKDKKIDEVKAESDIFVKVEVGLRGNTLAGDESKALVREVADELIDDPESSNQGFTIKTHNDDIIRFNKVTLKKYVNFVYKNSSIANAHAFEELETYFDELKENNLIDS